MNTLLIDGIPYPIGARVENISGEVGIITRYTVVSATDDRPLRVDFINSVGCGHYGPNAADPKNRVTLAGRIKYPEKPETLDRAGSEWVGHWSLDEEHNITIDGEEEPDAYTLES